jgi:hypothetical protein
VVLQDDLKSGGVDLHCNAAEHMVSEWPAPRREIVKFRVQGR